MICLIVGIISCAILLPCFGDLYAKLKNDMAKDIKKDLKSNLD